MRDALLSIGFGYMAHLCADATTANEIAPCRKNLLKGDPTCYLLLS